MQSKLFIDGESVDEAESCQTPDIIGLFISGESVVMEPDTLQDEEDPTSLQPWMPWFML